jgi:dihydrofolate reductase
MGKLIYGAITSLDGFVADEAGRFDWAEPDEEVHTFVNDLMREIGTHLYGRRLYEVMKAWETPTTEEHPHYMREYSRLWQNSDKIVFSKTLRTTSTKRTRLEQTFEHESIRQLKASSSSDAAVGGPDLASQAFGAGLVDECQLFLAPVVVGGGKRSMPIGLRLNLDLIEERPFRSGFVFLRYRTSNGDR